MNDYFDNLNDSDDDEYNITDYIDKNTTSLVDPNIIIKLHSEINELIAQLANTNKIKLIDLNEFFRNKNNKSRYFYDSGHLNDEGNIIASEFIASQIKNSK